MILELGPRAWAYWSDEQMFVGFLRRHLAGERFHSQMRRGRWVHPTVEMILQRTARPEWIWKPGPDDPSEQETIESIRGAA